MKKHAVLTCLIILPALGGCLPLEQAPLVYTSKAEFGVGVSAGQPEAPGFNVNIGFKSVDAALVPVAYAKHCGAKATPGCNNVKYDVSTVKGTNKLSAKSLLDQQIIKQFQDAIAAGNQNISINSGLIADKQRQLLEIDNIGPMETRLLNISASPALAPSRVVQPDGSFVDVPAPAPQLSADQIAERDKLQAEINRIKAIDRSTINSELKRLAAENVAAAAAVSANQEWLRQTLARSDSHNGDDKEDALSVYGSFNGNSTGNKEGADLTLGKVFSTGIAAQFIAQGLANSSPTGAVTQCIRSAQELIDKAKVSPSQAGVDTLVASCKPMAKN